MVRDEHEMLIEYSEMTTFNFNSKEYQEIKQDYINCKETVNRFDWAFKNFVKVFKKAEVM